MEHIDGHCCICGAPIKPGDEIALRHNGPACLGSIPLCRFGVLHLECSRVKAQLSRRMKQKYGLHEGTESGPSPDV